jgi:serine protease
MAADIEYGSQAMKHLRGCMLAAAAATVVGFSAQAAAVSVSGLLDGTLAAARGEALIPNQYIVTLRKAPDGHALAGLDVASQARQLLATVGGGKVLFAYEYALRGFAVNMTATQAQLLALNPLVASVNPDVKMKTVATQNGAVWGIDRADQRDLPLNGSYSYPDQGGQGVHVYVIDTGLNPNHAEFTGRVGTSRNFVGGLLGFGSVDPNAWTDCNGHGTHVSSSATGTSWGIAKKATIHAVRVLDCQGTGSGSAILGGMDWVIANAQQPAVANLSLGTLNGRSTDQETGVRNMVNANIAVAVAAGNDSANACNTSPAAEPAVLTVGATERTDARASYSNFGPCLDLFGPGSDIVAANYSNNSGSTSMSGTSMASPHVAGALALLRGQNPGLSAASVQNALVADSTPNKVTNPGAGSPNKLLYVANSGGGTPVDNPPVASFSFSCNNLACSFDGSGSTDDNGIASYSWAFGDASSGTGMTTTRTYAAAGTYNLTLTVTDGIGQTGQQTRAVTVTAAGGGNAPCTNCTKYTGTLASGAQTYHPGSGGFSYSGGTLKGYLRGPLSGADFDLYLERYSSGLLGASWSIVARGETTSSNENISYNATSGTYRWRVKSYSGAGSYEFYGEPK